MDTKMVTLKNGTVEDEGLVVSTMLALQELDPLELYELVETCRRPGRKISPVYGMGLVSKGLLGTDMASVHDSTLNIVLSAAAGKGLGLHLVSPMKE